MNGLTAKTHLIVRLLALGLMLHGIFGLPAVLWAGGLQPSTVELLSSPRFFCQVDLDGQGPSSSDEHDCNHCELCGAAGAALLPQVAVRHLVRVVVAETLPPASAQACAAHGLRANDRGPPRI